MGRKKIEIKLIKNERLRNITYNKRKKGLLKKLVELSIICGIQAKLELKDSFGNLIVVDAGSKETEEPKPEIPKNKVFVFTPEDYPKFQGFEKIRRKNQQDRSEEQVEKQPPPRIDDINSPVENQVIATGEFKKNKQPVRETLLLKPPLRIESHVPEAAIDQPPSQVAPPQAQLDTASADYLCYLQNLQLRAQLSYAEMQYKSLVSSFFNGQL